MEGERKRDKERERERERERESEDSVLSSTIWWLVGRLVGWLGFMATIVGYSCQIYFYTNNQVCFKQFNLAWVHNLIVQKISISSDSI